MGTSGSHACVESALPTESSPQCQGEPVFNEEDSFCFCSMKISLKVTFACNLVNCDGMYFELFIPVKLLLVPHV